MVAHSVFLDSSQRRRRAEPVMLIDCQTCPVRDVHCADCMVTALADIPVGAPGATRATRGLPLDRAEMATALRTVPEIEVPFEVEAEIVEDGEDIADPAVPGRIITLFQQPVKVVREQIWEEMETVQPIDWLRPPQPHTPNRRP